MKTERDIYLQNLILEDGSYSKMKELSIYGEMPLMYDIMFNLYPIQKIKLMRIKSTQRKRLPSIHNRRNAEIEQKDTPDV
jgi:hypothetical protein